jgi:ubiquinone/menaquinone biosynthesis C-methylase UbiE
MSFNADLLKPTASFWDAAAETYENRFTGTTVGQIRRQAVWQELERIFKPGHHILELNCGTGLDAVFLGNRGVKVEAFDISPRMIELAHEHSDRVRPATPPHFRVLPTEHLDTLAEGPFDGAFSNFSGLNCVEDLSEVRKSLARLLRPGSRFLLCMMGRFVPVEMLWFLAHGQPKRAFARLLSESTSYQEDTRLKIQRPTVSGIRMQMSPSFRLLRWKGAGITVPPSYAESFATRFPGLIRTLARFDQRAGALPLIRSMADCVILEFERS